MIPPRLTRLVRTPDLPAFQRAVALLACEGDPLSVRDRLVIVPTRGAGDVLRRTVEDLWLGGWCPDPSVSAACGVDPPAPARREGLVVPDLLVRDDWYLALASRLDGPTRVLSAFEREVLLRRAADETIDAGLSPPFRIRPRLLIAMQALYDALRRHRRTIDAFDRLVGGSLADSAAGDRGAERLLQQTRFLVAAFTAYERRLSDEAACDEHGLRVRLLETPLARPVDHIIVTVGDQVFEPEGLWAADYDLLTRLPDLQRITVVCTERMLATGLHERLHEWLPGIEEAHWPRASPCPVMLGPAASGPSRVFVSRDREEEVADFARYIRWSAREASAGPAGCLVLPHQALVYQRPLPYLYLAETVMGAARLPVQSRDGFPLASEPAALAPDLLLGAVESGFARGPLCDLLRSPLFVFDAGGAALRPGDVDALDTSLATTDQPLDVPALEALGGDPEPGGSPDGAGGHPLRAAARAAAAVMRDLSPLTRADAPVAHLARLREFLLEHRAPPPADRAVAERLTLAYGAIDEAVVALERAYSRWDGPEVEISALAAILRRWIESRTFRAVADPDGVQLLDSRAARYGTFERVRLAGLVGTEWSVAGSRNVFYPASLLAPLGWPREADRRAAARAMFDDLLTLASLETSVSAFALERDAIVQLSPLTEALGREDVTWTAWSAPSFRIFDEEAASIEPLVPDALAPGARAWFERRRARDVADDLRYRGFVGATPAAEHGVTKLETYLRCPFRYFAAHVLLLAEEPDEEPGLSPIERGRLVHEVLRTFFERWQRTEGRAITVESADRARALFADVVHDAVDRLSLAERALERARFLGTAGRPGIGDGVIRHEVERGVDVEDRRLEWALAGEVRAGSEGDVRQIRVRGVADRVDLLVDRTLRVVDYKMGRTPRPQTSVQPPIYAELARRRLEDEQGGRHWSIAEAGYLAFREPAGSAAIAGTADQAACLSEAVERAASAVAGIEAGRFPPRPVEPFQCTFCPYPGVCRKDYVGDD